MKTRKLLDIRLEKCFSTQIKGVLLEQQFEFTAAGSVPLTACGQRLYGATKHQAETTDIIQSSCCLCLGLIKSCFFGFC